MSLPGGHPGFWPVVHVPECYDADGCILLRPLPPEVARRRDEQTRAFMARREPWRSNPAWHEAACLCGECQRSRGGRP